jgi:ribosomal protein L15E
MMTNTSEFIDKLKKGAVDRCRERIIKARENPKGAITTTENYRQTRGLTSHSKKMRGL